ncbi:uncharacterized protein [Panulirus ornatus]|uniref:uncharacterized protein n=1 Tax=Panulirus ornatus TaxID=150431 RepID=UPI003A857699
MMSFLSREELTATLLVVVVAMMAMTTTAAVVPHGQGAGPGGQLHGGGQGHHAAARLRSDIEALLRQSSGPGSQRSHTPHASSVLQAKIDTLVRQVNTQGNIQPFSLEIGGTGGQAISLEVGQPGIFGAQQVSLEVGRPGLPHGSHGPFAPPVSAPRHAGRKTQPNPHFG